MLMQAAVLVKAQLPSFVENFTDISLGRALRRASDAPNDVILVFDVLLELDMALLEGSVEEVIVLCDLHLALANLVFLENVVA